MFAAIVDRRGRSILSVRDQNTFEAALRKKRLMTLIHLFSVHRYKAATVHYVSPTDDNRYQAQKMRTHGLFSDVHDEVGQIIVANVSAEDVKALLAAYLGSVLDVSASASGILELCDGLTRLTRDRRPGSSLAVAVAAG